jgi:hypothetical protein
MSLRDSDTNLDHLPKAPPPTESDHRANTIVRAPVRQPASARELGLQN